MSVQDQQWCDSSGLAVASVEIGMVVVGSKGSDQVIICSWCFCLEGRLPIYKNLNLPSSEITQLNVYTSATLYGSPI